MNTFIDKSFMKSKIDQIKNDYKHEVTLQKLEIMRTIVKRPEQAYSSKRLSISDLKTEFNKIPHIERENLREKIDDFIFVRHINDDEAKELKDSIEMFLEYEDNTGEHDFPVESGLQDYKATIKKLQAKERKYKQKNERIQKERENLSLEQDFDKETNAKPFKCPLSKKYFYDPVIATDDYIYEKEFIEPIANARGVSPISGGKLGKELRSYLGKKKETDEFIKRYHVPARERYLPSSLKEKMVESIISKKLEALEDCLYKEPRLLVEPLQDDGKGAIHIACESSNEAIVKTIVEEISRQQNKQGKEIASLLLTGSFSPLHLAIYSNENTGVLPYLLSLIENFSFQLNQCTVINDVNIQLNKLLIAAVKEGNIGRARLLLTLGANIGQKYKIFPSSIFFNSKNMDEGANLLHLAIKYSHVEMVQFLLEKNANLVREKDNSGNTPLHLALSKVGGSNNDAKGIKNSDKNLIKLLVDSTNDKQFLLNQKNNNGETGLHCLVKSPLVKWLSSKEQDSLLEKRATKKVLLQSIFSLILRAKLNVSAVDNSNDTFLHLAATEEAYDVVEIAIALHVSTAVKNNNNETPMDIIKRNNKERYEYFLEEERKLNENHKTFYHSDILPQDVSKFEQDSSIIIQNNDPVTFDADSALFTSSSSKKTERKQNLLAGEPLLEEFICIQEPEEAVLRTVAQESVHRTVPNNKLRLDGLTCQRIPGDGHCLYNAVALYLGRTQQSLRQVVAAHLEHNFDDFRGFLLPPEGRSVEDYIRDVREGIEWASHVEIEVLMRLLGRPIMVVCLNGRLRNADDARCFKGEPIFVYYNDYHHYDALLLTGEKDARTVLNDLLLPQTTVSLAMGLHESTSKTTKLSVGYLRHGFLATSSKSPEQILKQGLMTLLKQRKVIPKNNKVELVFTDLEAAKTFQQQLMNIGIYNVNEPGYPRKIELHNDQNQFVLTLSEAEYNAVRGQDEAYNQLVSEIYHPMREACSNRT